MNKLFTLAAVSLLSAVSLSLDAQVKEDFVSMSTNQYGQKYPMVNSERRVRARIYAPKANEVQLQINGILFPMTKDAEGYWMGDSEPFDEGNHYYALVIDGAEVPDPGSRFLFGSGAERTQIEIPAHDDYKYALRDIPHGQIRELYFHSDVTGGLRHVYVYTPPMYDDDLSTRYPVLYLQHGYTENETGWSNQGHAGLIMDNLLADGKSQPFIIVMENGEVSHQFSADQMSGGGMMEAAFQRFPSILMNDVIPYIDSHFRTKADAKHRALAGLSMGGMQTRNISLANPTLFSQIGIFSGGVISEDDLKQNPEFLKHNKLTFVSYGSRELENPRGGVKTEDVVAQARKAGLNVHFYVSPDTAHEWQSWRRSLYEFAQLLFR